MRKMHREDRECLEVLTDAYGLDRVLAEISRIRDSKAKDMMQRRRGSTCGDNVVQLHAERINPSKMTNKNPPTEEFADHFVFPETVPKTV